MNSMLRSTVILSAVVSVLVAVPACSKDASKTEAPVVQIQKQDMEAQKAAEELERKRLEREASERALRAEKIKFQYEDINFRKGSYALPPDAQDMLKKKAEWLQKNPDVKVIIEGHTDERGSKEHNLALGEHRAGAVKTFLLRQGIDPSRLIAVSYGNERPIDTAKTENARAKNRRVHFVIE